MTSELRPAVAVWEADRELTIAALHAWAEHIGAGYSCPAAAQTMLMAATILEADREAVRAEQAAELAKFKALAETLAGALATAASCLSQCAEGLATQNDMETWAEDVAEALREYKEARDAS